MDCIDQSLVFSRASSRVLGMAVSVGQFVTLVRAEIYQQISDGLLQRSSDFSPRTSSATTRLTFVVLSELLNY